MAYMDGTQANGKLPKDHWIHKAIAKESSRLSKKKPMAKEGDAPNPKGEKGGEAAVGNSHALEKGAC